MADTCEHEGDVRRMVRNDDDDAVLRGHAARCTACRETLHVAVWMQQMATLTVDCASTPDPAYLWWKAQLLRQWDAQRKVLAPIEIWEQVEVVIGLAVAVVLLVLFWDEVPTLAMPRPSGDLAAWLTMAGTVTPVVVASALLMAGTVSVVIRALIAKK